MSDILVAGVDYARGGSDLSNPSKSDDFSIATGRLKGDRTQFVHMFRYSGVTAAQASYIIHEQHMKMGYSFIVGDPGGGFIFVRDEMRKPKQDNGQSTFKCRPIITADDTQLAGVGDPILILFQTSDPRLGGDAPQGLGLSFKSTAGPINKAHELCKTDLEKKVLEFPKKWEGWSKSGFSFNSPDAMRKWLNKQTLSPMDKVRAEIDLTLLQLITVDRKTDKEGNPMLDSHGYYTFVSKRKKDSAYALVYMNFAAWLLRQLSAMQEKINEDNRDFYVMSENVNPFRGLR